MRILIISLVVPLAFSFWPGLRFYRNWKALLKSIALVVAIFGTWDIWATFRGHWSFDADGVWPIRVINLPLEELLFFVVIPFCCIFTWEVIKYFKERLQ